MRNSSKYALLGLLFVLIAASCSSPTSASIKKGDKAPDFTLPALDGKKVSLKDILAPASKKDVPKAVLIDFWATWCGPCRQSAPHLQKLHESYAKDGLRVIGISLDKGSKDKVDSFAKKEKLTYKILTDPDSKVGSKYQVRYLPTMYLLDGKGKVVQVFTGYSKDIEKNIDKAVKDLLK